MVEDRYLVWRFKSGSKDALRAIYEKYADDLISLAGNLLDDKTGAEDVVQDVFVSFVQSIGKFRLTGSLKGYLATCVANRSRDYQRRTKPGSTGDKQRRAKKTGQCYDRAAIRTARGNSASPTR
jgi:RNA polymerase sigma-70 factor (ECF subfamily)